MTPVRGAHKPGETSVRICLTGDLHQRSSVQDQPRSEEAANPRQRLQRSSNLIFERSCRLHGVCSAPKPGLVRTRMPSHVASEQTFDERCRVPTQGSPTPRTGPRAQIGSRPEADVGSDFCRCSAASRKRTFTSGSYPVFFLSDPLPTNEVPPGAAITNSCSDIHPLESRKWRILSGASE